MKPNVNVLEYLTFFVISVILGGKAKYERRQNSLTSMRSYVTL